MVSEPAVRAAEWGAELFAELLAELVGCTGAFQGLPGRKGV
jgi:hypothetical protein